ncbi:hypothetical protein JYU34_018679 [Plutella xylostella]|uniref:Essential protein Yae1 N-terminal domain-containing protein n=1 Tax=Plutella xylostella TaxID=51655 RepID=A0ABQ7PYD9_PLUXY|nr:hypothetical protein JYU34_018679 [Plutella xylostella]
MAELDVESSAISVKTRNRTLEPITKAGYMDGAADGQASVYQSSFDVGYQQGLHYGIKFGLHDAQNWLRNSNLPLGNQEMKSVNCQICSNSTVPQQNIVNLVNEQKEQNDKYLKDKECQ